MRTIAELDDVNLGIGELSRRTDCLYTERHTARAVVFSTDKKIPLIHASGIGYHLPGGGLDKNEDWQQALRRECAEELGCIVEVRPLEVGCIVEYRNFPTIGQYDRGLKQISLCGVADVTGACDQSLSDDEIKLKTKAEWFDIDSAVTIMEKQLNHLDEKNIYEAAFVRMRDFLFLKETRKILQKY